MSNNPLIGKLLLRTNLLALRDRKRDVVHSMLIELEKYSIVIMLDVVSAEIESIQPWNKKKGDVSCLHESECILVLI